MSLFSDEIMQEYISSQSLYNKGFAQLPIEQTGIINLHNVNLSATKQQLTYQKRKKELEEEERIRTYLAS